MKPKPTSSIVSDMNKRLHHPPSFCACIYRLFFQIGTLFGTIRLLTNIIGSSTLRVKETVKTMKRSPCLILTLTCSPLSNPNYHPNQLEGHWNPLCVTMGGHSQLTMLTSIKELYGQLLKSNQIVGCLSCLFTRPLDKASLSSLHPSFSLFTFC